MNSAIRVVATNRKLTARAVAAVNKANEAVTSKKSPLVVLVAKPEITGRAITLTAKHFGSTKSNLPQPLEAAAM